MSKLVPPHGSESVKPLLLPEAERAEEGKRAEKLKKIPLDFTCSFGRFDARHGRVYAAHRVYGV